MADVRTWERDYRFSHYGRMFHFKKPNPNSGIVFNIGDVYSDK